MVDKGVIQPRFPADVPLIKPIHCPNSCGAVRCQVSYADLVFPDCHDFVTSGMHASRRDRHRWGGGSSGGVTDRLVGDWEHLGREQDFRRPAR